MTDSTGDGPVNNAGGNSGEDGESGVVDTEASSGSNSGLTVSNVDPSPTIPLDLAQKAVVDPSTSPSSSTPPNEAASSGVTTVGSFGMTDVVDLAAQSTQSGSGSEGVQAASTGVAQITAGNCTFGKMRCQGNLVQTCNYTGDNTVGEL